MDVSIVKVIVIGVVLTGAFVVAPVIMALLSHQQKMAQLFAKQNIDQTELLRRLEMVEQRLSAGVDKPLPSQPPAPPAERPELRSPWEAESHQR